LTMTRALLRPFVARNGLQNNDG